MSSLQRYKKSGGFFQLLSLIETFGPTKKEKFLEMIESESPAWAQALREKMLTLERIFTWTDDAVVEVFKNLQPKTLAFALEGIKPEQKERIAKYFSHSEMRRIGDVLSESKPKPEEIASSVVKIVEMARKLIQDKVLHAEKFDQKLLIPEDFEASLEGGAGSAAAHHHAHHAAASGAAHASEAVLAAAAAQAADPSKAPTLEVAQLQRTLALMLKENKALKEDIHKLQHKLDQIRKFAA